MQRPGGVCVVADDLSFTRPFSLQPDPGEEIRQTLTTVYDALQEKGYNIRKLDRDELLQVLLQAYLDI